MSLRRAINHVTVDSRATLNCSIFGGKRVIPLSAWENLSMVGVGDIVELLKRWDRWKRIDETPERIDALEKRIAELEARLKRAPGEACPKCGALEYRVEKSTPHPQFGEMGTRVHHMKCGACGFADEKMILPGKR